MAPRRPNVIVLAKPRSGSHLVSCIFGYNGWGVCNEILNYSLVKGKPFVRGDQATNSSIIKNIIEGTSQKTPRVASIHLFQVKYVAGLCGIEVTDLVSMIEQILDPSVFVATTRCDTVEQAVSWYLAKKSRWWSKAITPIAPYDESDLLQYVYEFESSPRHRWEPYFDQYGPATICYEELCSNPEGVISRVGSHIGFNMRVRSLSETNIRKVNHPEKDAYIERLRSVKWKLHSDSFSPVDVWGMSSHSTSS